MTVEIELTQGMVALIDDEDLDLVQQHRWCARYDRRSWNALTSARRLDGRKTTMLMHRLIVGVEDPKAKVVHVNGNGLDNRRRNLRVCTESEIQWGREVRADNKSGYKGVGWNETAGQWQARIRHHGKLHHLGYFDDPAEAYAAYCRAADELHGAFKNYGALREAGGY